MHFCGFYSPDDKLSELRREEKEAREQEEREARAKRMSRKLKQKLITNFYPILVA